MGSSLRPTPIRSGPRSNFIIACIFSEPSKFVGLQVPNEAKQIRAAIIRLVRREEKCPLFAVLTLGGTGPGLNVIIVPDVTLGRWSTCKLPGFGEIMRYYSYERFKVSVLSRAEGGARQKLGDQSSGQTQAREVLPPTARRKESPEALEQIAGIDARVEGG